MAVTRFREIHLKRRLVGLPAVDDFEIVTAELPHPREGEVQVYNHWLSVDPYMYGLMSGAANSGGLAPHEGGVPIKRVR